MRQSRLIGIFGGTFDPVHNGHLKSAESLADELAFDRIYLIPNATPPHRSSTWSTAEHRLKMVQLAVRDYPKLIADDRECRRGGKSYTVDTLKSFRTENPDDSLAFIVGMDAYLDIPNWKRWRKYLDYSHIIVMQRPGCNHEVSWGAEFITQSLDQLIFNTHGQIYFAASKLLDISATIIREKLNSNDHVNLELPQSVMNYINQHQLYETT